MHEQLSMKGLCIDSWSPDTRSCRPLWAILSGYAGHGRLFRVVLSNHERPMQGHTVRSCRTVLSGHALSSFQVMWLHLIRSYTVVLLAHEGPCFQTMLRRVVRSCGAVLSCHAEPCCQDIQGCFQVILSHVVRSCRAVFRSC